MNYRKTPDRPTETGERRRTFVDEEGIYWDVREVKNADYDRRGGLSLVFESQIGFRRVRNYPPNWYESSEPDLARLSRKT